MKNHRAQITPGLMMGVGIIVFLFLLVTIFVVNQNLKLFEKEDYIQKRGECLKLANLINSVYINGPGTEVETHTKYLITTFNSSQISIQDIESINESGGVPKIAFLASEAGPTSQDFYNEVNSELNPDPDWYKICFSDLDDDGCSWGETSWMETLIPKNLTSLIDDLGNYNTIYLEDPTIYYTTDFIEKLENWVDQGNALILSEHVMCRETSFGSPGSFPNTSYRCNVDDTSDDEWGLFGVTLHQEGNAFYYPNQYNVIVNDTDEAYNLAIGDQLSFEERSYLENSNITNFKTIAKYINSFLLSSSRNQPAIAHWDYGNGKVFYFGDFQVEYISSPNKNFSQTLTELISIAYYLIIQPEKGSDFTCHFSAFAPYQVVTGDIKIINIDNSIFVENVNKS